MLPRVVVLLLLAMNVGVAVWWALRPAPVPAPSLAASEPGVPSLRLLGEAEPGDSAVDAEPPGPAIGIGNGVDRQCLEVGPFLTQIDLRRAMNALAPAAARIQFRETREVIRRGYRVFLPSPGSREAALNQARQLSAKGLSDYYVVTAGDEQNTISLGLYRDLGNAEKRREQVRLLGIEPHIEPRNEELPQFWIDIDIARGSNWRGVLGGYVGVGSNEIPCAIETDAEPARDGAPQLGPPG